MDEWQRLAELIDHLRQQVYHVSRDMETEIRSLIKNTDIISSRLQYDSAAMRDKIRRLEARLYKLEFNLKVGIIVIFSMVLLALGLLMVL